MRVLQDSQNWRMGEIDILYVLCFALLNFNVQYPIQIIELVELSFRS